MALLCAQLDSCAVQRGTAERHFAYVTPLPRSAFTLREVAMTANRFASAYFASRGGNGSRPGATVSLSRI